MQENQSPPRAGRTALAAREAAVLARMRSVQSRCVRPVLQQGDVVVIRWVFDFTDLQSRRARIEELAWQRWCTEGDSERIAEETFFYDPAQMQFSETLSNQ